MPRNRNTSRKGKPKAAERAAGLGRALQNAQEKKFVVKSNGAGIHAQGMMATGATSIGLEDAGKKTMLSVLEIDDLQVRKRVFLRLLFENTFFFSDDDF
jgi:hypothetical protein